jgi:hypothetical protein
MKHRRTSGREPDQPRASSEERYPWDPEPPSDDYDGDASPSKASDGKKAGERHDAFTEARKCVFLKALVKTGCIQDACRLTGTVPRTVYRHQRSDPRFFDHCRAALRMSGTPTELTAWQRAVEGVEEEYVCAGEVRVRRRYDHNLLRLLLQGSNPRKYGPRPGFKRKRLLRHERKRMEREIRAEIAAERELAQRSPEEVTETIVQRVAAIRRHSDRAKLAAGWTRAADGYLLPPGYGPIAGWVPPAPPPGGEDPGDSM